MNVQKKLNNKQILKKLKIESLTELFKKTSTKYFIDFNLDK